MKKPRSNHLDDTLYPLCAGLAAGCLNNIKDYMVEKLGIEKSKISDLCDFFTRIMAPQWLDFGFVHGILPYDNLKLDPVLRTLLLSLPYRKVVFTNADKIHATKALNRLGLEGCFEGILCFEKLNPTHKTVASDDEDDIEFIGSSPPSTKQQKGTSDEIFDIIAHFAQPNPDRTVLPKTPIVCKPSEDAI